MKKLLTIFAVAIFAAMALSSCCGCEQTDIKSTKVLVAKERVHLYSDDTTNGYNRFISFSLYWFELDGHQWYYTQDGGLQHSPNCPCLNKNTKNSEDKFTSEILQQESYFDY